MTKVAVCSPFGGRTEKVGLLLVTVSLLYMTQVTCQDCSKGACRSHPCIYSGTCQVRGDGYECICKENYTGVNCESCLCGENSLWAAWSEGTCSKSCGLGIMYQIKVCYLRDPLYLVCFTSRMLPCWNDSCSGNECTSNPCQHGATCIQQVNGYSCNCTDPYVGSNCEQCECRLPLIWTTWQTDQCSVTCGGGTFNRSRTCASVCTMIETVPCATHVCLDDYCHSNPCENGATCVNEATRYNCSCALGYMGERCRQCYCIASAMWSTWTTGLCSVTCGQGTTTKSRSCYSYRLQGPCLQNVPAPCFSQPCPGTTTIEAVNGKVTASTTVSTATLAEITYWSSWSSFVCSVTCGEGIARKVRVCASTATCIGPASQTHVCIKPDCIKPNGLPKNDKGSNIVPIVFMLLLTMIIISAMSTLSAYLILSRRIPTDDETRIVRLLRDVFNLSDESWDDAASTSSVYDDNTEENDESLSLDESAYLNLPNEHTPVKEPEQKRPQLAEKVIKLEHLSESAN